MGHGALQPVEGRLRQHTTQQVAAHTVDATIEGFQNGHAFGFQKLRQVADLAGLNPNCLVQLRARQLKIGFGRGQLDINLGIFDNGRVALAFGLLGPLAHLCQGGMRLLDLLAEGLGDLVALGFGFSDALFQRCRHKFAFLSHIVNLSRQYRLHVVALLFGSRDLGFQRCDNLGAFMFNPDDLVLQPLAIIGKAGCVVLETL